MSTEAERPAAMAGAVRVKLWDWPVRLVHWALVGLIAALWWSAEHDQMFLHKTLGSVALGLVVFRVLWGVFGSSTARFAGFVKGPAAVWRYARGLARGGAEGPSLGHNPMGGLSVVALLAVLAGEIGLGLYCVDVDGLESGPLADRVSFEAGRSAAHWHHLLFNGLIGLIGLHLLAIGCYALVRRENLVGPMITGTRRLPLAGSAPGFTPKFAPVWRAAAAAAASTIIAVFIAKGARL